MTIQEWKDIPSLTEKPRVGAETLIAENAHISQLCCNNKLSQQLTKIYFLLSSYMGYRQACLGLASCIFSS